MENYTDLMIRLAQRIETLKICQERLQNLPTLPIPDPQPHTTATGFLDLPFELRLQIYHYSVFRKRVINVSAPRYDDYFLNDDRFMDILLLSKQISNECLDILYGENFFKVKLNGLGEYHFKKKFTDENRRRMKHIVVIAQPHGVSYPDSIPDVELWASTLPYLKTIRFIAEQPSSQFPGNNKSEKEKHEWIKWIGLYFKVFGQLLEDVPAIIEVDDDGREDTNELVDKYLPKTCQKIRCSRRGDFVFRRGRFSNESGYWDDYYDDGRMSSRDV